ncbi:hypothetical protein TcasGA2_TC033752 [Tribolium castaneum]|uniref:Uncharacterized protein n=1 Tax=Tribolium castaneum TaxID=7070 RepID=A0A139WEV3_TRICA|nr:hypothetical protein TcasGA2_TC033752 [Tribolium castaneum]
MPAQRLAHQSRARLCGCTTYYASPHNFDRGRNSLPPGPDLGGCPPFITTATITLFSGDN